MRKKMTLLLFVFFLCSSIYLIVWNTPVHAQTIEILSGRVEAIYPVFGYKGSMTIESDDKIYTIYTGIRTVFHPPHWPVPGDWVRVRYIIDRRGYYRAYDVYIDIEED